MIYLEKLEEAKKKKGRCWTGYKPKPGSVPYSKGSCVKEGYKLLGLALIDEEGPVKKAADKFAKKKEAESIAKTKKDYEAVYGKRKREDAHTSYQQIGDVLSEVVSKAVLSSDETVKRRLDRRRAVVTGRMNKARKDSLDPRGTNSRRGVGSENKEMDDEINTADVTRSKSYKKKYPKNKA